MYELLGNSNYQVALDGLRAVHDGADGFVEVTGWANDFFRKRPLGIEVSEANAAVVTRVPRPDVAGRFNLPVGESFGFSIKLPPGAKRFVLLAETPGEVFSFDLDVRRCKMLLSLSDARSAVGRAVRSGGRLLTHEGRASLAARMHGTSDAAPDPYLDWIRENETASCEDAAGEMEAFSESPLISIVTPVFNVEERWLRRCIASVQAQWYENWELCLADDCSTDDRVREVLTELSQGDARIKVVFRNENGGISAATNSAIELATGDLIAFMDNDDELAPQALFEVVRALNTDPDIDFIYTDEDKIDVEGRRFDPFSKPGYSPQLLWGHNYITHFVAVRRPLLERVGMLRSEFDGSQDYDFVLRATAAAKRVHHIPEVLYHWRTLPSSVAGDPRSKMYAYEAGKRALEASVRAAGFHDASVDMLPNLGTYQVRFPISGDETVLVAVTGGADVSMEVERVTAYGNAVVEGFDSPDQVLCRAEELDVRYIALVDNAVPLSSDWLDTMLGYLRQDRIGAVGGNLVDSHGRELDTGVTLKALEAGRPYEGEGHWLGDVGYYFRTSLARDIFAVTERCLCMRRDDFCALAGLDSSLPQGLRGVDLCERLTRLRGKTAVWQPFASFVAADDRAYSFEARDIDLFLSRFPHPPVDLFASRWYPYGQDDAVLRRHAIAYRVNNIVKNHGLIEVTGWAANVHSGSAAAVSPAMGLGSPEEGGRVERFLDAEACRFAGVPIDAPIGFRVRAKADGDTVRLHFSAPEEDLIVPVSVTRSAIARKQARHYASRALREASHPKRLLGMVSQRLREASLAGDRPYRRYISHVEPGLWAHGELSYRPLISILVPVYNVEERWLERCVDSVLRQTYPNWELCLADDHSSDPSVRPNLERLASMDDRIKVVFRNENGHISRATNSALEIAAGEFVALMDNDDELAPQALYEVVAALNVNPSLDLIYSDEDKIDEEGNRTDPTFKPDFSPDLLFSTNYISHLGVYRTEVARAIGGFRAGYEGSQDYDFVLRFIERTSRDRIYHVPRILYHWRMIATSTAADPSSKSYAFIAGQRALQDALDRAGLDASADMGPLNGIYNVHYRVPGEELVSIIIPTKDGYDNIERCVTSIISKTTYPAYEVLIVDNGSLNPKMRGLYKQLDDASGGKVRVIDADIPFNFSRINNLAAHEARGKYLLFLNDDTEVIAPGWLTTMVSFAQQDRVGVVGAKLYYPYDKVQHAGVVLGLTGVAGHVFSGALRDEVGRYGRLMENANYYAVTAACCMVRSDVFNQIGGFDETYEVAYNDVDLCIRIHDTLGKDVVFAHEAELYHYESVTRGYDRENRMKKRRLKEEAARFYRQHKSAVDHDPYFNENLSRSNWNFEVRTS